MHFVTLLLVQNNCYSKLSQAKREALHSEKVFVFVHVLRIYYRAADNNIDLLGNANL